MSKAILLGLVLSLLAVMPVTAADTAKPKPIGIMIVHHKVVDFGKWLPVFKSDASYQKAAGLTRPRIYQSADDPTDVVITFTMADVVKAKEFASAPRLKDVMQKAGVVGAPEIMYLRR